MKKFVSPKVKPPCTWEFKWLYKYLDRQAVMRKLQCLPTEGLENELRYMRRAIKAGTTCYVSYRRGKEHWRWHVERNCLDVEHATRFAARSWDPVDDHGPRFNAEKAAERRRMVRKTRQHELAQRKSVSRPQHSRSAISNFTTRPMARRGKIMRVSKPQLGPNPKKKKR